MTEFCKGCGRELKSGALFCSSCGISVRTLQNPNQDNSLQKDHASLKKCAVNKYRPISTTIDYSPSEAATSDGYFFEDSDKRRLTETEIAPLTPTQLRLARNELYARRGYIFNSVELRDYFSKKSWYIPDSSYDGTTLNEIEKYNVELIQSKERDLK